MRMSSMTPLEPSSSLTTLPAADACGWASARNDALENAGSAQAASCVRERHQMAHTSAGFAFQQPA